MSARPLHMTLTTGDPAHTRTVASVEGKASRIKRILHNSTGFLIGLMVLGVISGCVSNSTLPAPNISTILTATENTNTAERTTGAKVAATEQTVADKAEKPEANNKTEAAPAPSTQTALLPEAQPASPAESATVTAAQTSNLKPAPEANAAATAEEAPANAAPAQVKPANNLLALFQNNAAANGRADKSGTTTTRSSSTFASRSATPIRAATTIRRKKPQVIVTRNGSRDKKGTGNLPGVNLKTLFGIDTEEVEEMDEVQEVASVTNRAMRGTHGLLLQRPSVQVACFKPELIAILKKVERKFGRTPIVTSGYRSPAYNRRIRGAKNSMHIQCKAADIQVKGVSKWTLAKYLRSLPTRGGVGTYCHTDSVHIDIAGKRDWNRRCRRSRTVRKKKA